MSLALPLSLAGLLAAPAADLAPLVRATQRLARDPDALTVVWWLPPSFIEGIMEQGPMSSEERLERRQTLAALDGYALFALLHMSRDKSGMLAAASRDEVLKNSRLEVQGKTLSGVAPGQVSPEAQDILDGIRRGLIGSMGLNGQALYIVAYPAEENGLPLFDPKVVPQFTFHLYGHEFVFSTRLPDIHSVPAAATGNTARPRLAS